MYQFSRSIYRELGPQVDGERCKDVAALRQQFLRSCEVTMERLATDRHYFAKPTKTLFNDVRAFFPIGAQLRVYRVIERHVALASEYVERIRATFQIFSIPRRSWMITECRNAVAVSHGSSEAFSTGSHAQ